MFFIYVNANTFNELYVNNCIKNKDRIYYEISSLGDRTSGPDGVLAKIKIYIIYLLLQCKKSKGKLDKDEINNLNEIETIYRLCWCHISDFKKIVHEVSSTLPNNSNNIILLKLINYIDTQMYKFSNLTNLIKQIELILDILYRFEFIYEDFLNLNLNKYNNIDLVLFQNYIKCSRNIQQYLNTGDAQFISFDFSFKDYIINTKQLKEKNEELDKYMDNLVNIIDLKNKRVDIIKYIEHLKKFNCTNNMLLNLTKNKIKLNNLIYYCNRTIV